LAAGAPGMEEMKIFCFGMDLPPLLTRSFVAKIYQMYYFEMSPKHVKIEILLVKLRFS
jgi:hypothetical protein